MAITTPPLSSPSTSSADDDDEEEEEEARTLHPPVLINYERAPDGAGNSALSLQPLSSNFFLGCFFFLRGGGFSKWHSRTNTSKQASVMEACFCFFLDLFVLNLFFVLGTSWQTGIEGVEFHGAACVDGGSGRIGKGCV